MFYVRMQIDRLLCSIDLEMFLILKIEKLYIILPFWQILIVQLSGISVIKLQYIKWAKLRKELDDFYLMTRKVHIALFLKRVCKPLYIWNALNELPVKFTSH